MQSWLHRTRERSQDPSFGQLQTHSNRPWAYHTWWCLSSKSWAAFYACSQLCSIFFETRQVVNVTLNHSSLNHLCQVWHSVPGQVRLQIDFASLPSCWRKGDSNLCTASSCSSFEAQCDVLPPSSTCPLLKCQVCPQWPAQTCRDTQYLDWGMAARTERRSHIKSGSIIAATARKHDNVYKSKCSCWHYVQVHYIVMSKAQLFSSSCKPIHSFRSRLRDVDSDSMDDRMTC